MVVLFFKKLFCKVTSIVKNSSCDPKSDISYNVKFYNSSIGSYSYISNNCNIFHAKIGKYTSIGLGCNIGGGEHPINWVSTSPAFQNSRTFPYGFKGHSFNPYKKTEIGNDVWIAPNVTIKTGINIADGAIIGGGSIVTKNVGPYEIWAGNPAKLIRKRFSDEIIHGLLQTEWWNWPEEKIMQYSTYFDNPEEFLTQCRNNGDI